jgi:hypothetical protein
MINHYENFLLLLWPDLKSYGVARKDICKKIAGSVDFSIYMEFSVSKKDNYVNEKINLLWKLPDVFSISIDSYQYDWENKIHDSHLFFTNYTDGNNELKYEGKDVYFEFDKINKLLITYSTNENVLDYYFNDILMHSIKIENSLYNLSSDNQILIGTNSFTEVLTYSIDFKYLVISEKTINIFEIDIIKENYIKELNEYDEYSKSDEYGLLALYDFKKYNTFKVYDYTGNNNHIYIQQI